MAVSSIVPKGNIKVQTINLKIENWRKLVILYGRKSTLLKKTKMCVCLRSKLFI